MRRGHILLAHINPSGTWGWQKAFAVPTKWELVIQPGGDQISWCLRANEAEQDCFRMSSDILPTLQWPDISQGVINVWRCSTQKSRCSVSPPTPALSGFIIYYTVLEPRPPQFCRLPETLGMPRAWLAGQMHHGSERQRWRERRPQSRWGSEGLQQTQRVREGNARRGCDHPGLASSNRLYLRQGRWSPPGPHTKQGKKQPDKTDLKNQVTETLQFYPWLPVKSGKASGKNFSLAFFFFW